MLRMVAHKSAAAAKAYYTEGLKREDYYSEKQEVVGKWHGLAAELLGLAADVKGEAFAALAENRHPITGEKLTPRTKLDRRVGYDINFHAPKSLSVLYAMTGDKDLLRVFREAVAETMNGVEAETATRVRRKNAQAERVTGNLVWAEFVHFTARPVGGIPDPHLHIHGFAFNSTFDPVEERWKAVSWAAIKKDAPYSEAVFHSLLTDKLADLGYGIERKRGGWEIAGIPRSVVDKFSRRTAEIERLAAAKGITDAKEKDALGAASREGKRRGLTQSDLRAAWNVRLTSDEKAAIASVAARKNVFADKAPITPERAIDEACEKLFARDSVVETKRVVAEALRFGVSQVTPDAAWAAMEKLGLVVRQIGTEKFCTSLDALAEEVALINFVRSGRDMHAPFMKKIVTFGIQTFTDQEKAAIYHLLKSQDQVMAVRGVAGVGKTTLMQEVVPQIEKAGFKVFAFAPSASASRETLRQAGFTNAETIARLLVDKKLQAETRGNVIWIDEAGQVGAADLWRVMQLAGSHTRVILTGDTAQHAPVARGDAFRLLQKYSGLPVAEVTRIRRQDGETYRKAVAALSRGDLPTAFRRLDELGAFIEIEDDGERYRRLADDFLKLSRKGSVPLVISPTHAEGAKVTAAIRAAKHEAGWLGPERLFIQLHNLQWEEADRRRPENYAPGLVVQFHQNASGIRRGAVLRVNGEPDPHRVKAVSETGVEIVLPLDEAAKFQVFEEREIMLARGDRLRITRNGTSDDGRRLNNGNIFTVAKFSRDGKIVLDTGAVIDAKRGAHIALGYVSTSHSAQSKSVRDVLVAQSEASFLASSREQFYVSVSRGKESIRIYTDSRRGLQEAVGNTSQRQAGVELAGLKAREINSFMNKELNGRQWSDLIRSRRAEGMAKSHVQNLLRERRQDGLKKPETMDFRQYLEMRRGMAGADGKSRSKGYSGATGEKKGEIQNRGRSFLRPTEPKTPQKEKVAATNISEVKAAPPAARNPATNQTRHERLAQGLAAARSHFAKVSEKANGAFQATEKRAHPLPQSSIADAARHGMKQRAADTARAAKTKVQAQVKAPAPVPVMRSKR